MNARKREGSLILVSGGGRRVNNRSNNHVEFDHQEFEIEFCDRGERDGKEWVPSFLQSALFVILRPSRQSREMKVT